MTTLALSKYQRTQNMIIPDEGPVIIPTELDFSGADRIDIETEALFSSGKVSLLQGVFIDNYSNANPLVLFNNISRQRIVCPANSQGYFDVFVPKPSTFQASTTSVADLSVKIHFYNVPIASGVWPNGSGGGGGGGEAPATFTSLNTFLTGGNDVVDGSACTKHLFIQNQTGNQPVYVDLSNGGGQGIELLAGGSLVLDGGIATDFIVSGTLGDIVTIVGGA